MVKESRVDVILQRIEEPIGEELNTIPSKIRRYGVNNIFQRAFSYLIGWRSDGKPIKLEATAGGALKIADIGAGLESVYNKTGIATDTLSSAVDFGVTVHKIRIISEDYGFYFYPSIDGNTFYDSILVKDNADFFVDLSCRYFKVKRSGSNDAKYRIEGYR